MVFWYRHMVAKTQKAVERCASDWKRDIAVPLLLSYWIGGGAVQS
jgi:hypothetical protein